MPILKIQINITLKDEGTFRKEASSFISELLTKPENYVMIVLEQAGLSFAGTSDPAAWMDLKSIALPEDRTSEFSEKLCSFIEEQTGIPKNRMYIEFTNVQRHLLGWDGRTFG